MADEVKLLLTGHSFIRRVVEHGNPPRQFRCGAQVLTYHKGGCRIAGRNPFLPYIDKEMAKHENINCVIFQLGNNDIPRYKGREHLTQLAVSYVTRVSELCVKWNMEAVICSEIPRGYMGSFEDTSWFNSELDRLILEDSRIFYWRHKGLHKRNGAVLLPDRVHLNGKGQTKYFHSLQAAMRCAVRRIKVLIYYYLPVLSNTCIMTSHIVI